jgi:hypothetical protein
VVNTLFADQLKQYVVKHDYAELFSNVIADVYNSSFSSPRDNRSELLKEINGLNDKLAKARELLLNGDIDGVDYKAIKTENEVRIVAIEAKLSELAAGPKRINNIESIINKAIIRLTQLDAIYCNSNTFDKRQLIGSMYPEKFTFEELQYRTARTSELYSCIYLINNELEIKKRRASDDFSCLPTLAPQTGWNSNHFINQLKKLNELQLYKMLFLCKL